MDEQAHPNATSSAHLVDWTRFSNESDRFVDHLSSDDRAIHASGSRALIFKRRSVWTKENSDWGVEYRWNDGCQLRFAHVTEAMVGEVVEDSDGG